MARIFICYRRDDTSGHAGRLYDRLRQQFGDDVFMDISGIDPGVDYADLIDQTLSSIDVVLVMIGREWLNATDGEGRRRLENPHDLVHEEISQALARDDVRVIPVLVENARLPTSDEMPPDLAPLARRNAIELTDERWSYDTDRLCETIEGVLRPGSHPADKPPQNERSDKPERRRQPALRQRLPLITAGLITVGAVAVALVFFLNSRGETQEQSPVGTNATPTPITASDSETEAQTTKPDEDSPEDDSYVTLEAESGVLEAPMMVLEDPAASGGLYISSATREEGSVVLGPFQVPAGRYVIEVCARPLGPNPTGSDSAYVKLNGSSTRFHWDFFEGSDLPSDWDCEEVSARCGGTFESHSCNPLDFDWEAGEHTITFETLEPDFGLDLVTVRPYSG